MYNVQWYNVYGLWAGKDLYRATSRSFSHTELQRKQEMEIPKILRTFEIFLKNIALTGLNEK